MAITPPTDLLRSLPQVEETLHEPELRALEALVPRAMLADCVRAAVDETRRAVLAGTCTAVDPRAVAEDACLRALLCLKPSLRRVVNATGVIVHTNLGRSPLAQEAVDAVVDVARGYSTLEYDTRAMARGSRHDHVEHLICALTGAEAAIAVNNNAAAVMMVLTEFASGHEAVVSRGELVEIGGSFRVPDIMALSGAAMVEAGTTNKTHLADYERALSPDTAMLLKVHPSNYRMVGFVESVGVAELRRLADEENARRGARRGERGGVLVYEDQGSGAFLRLDCFGAYAEPAVAESLRAGCDLVSFSGDKLLGGPQAGIVAGSRELVGRLKKNPLARALRLDKMTLAALEATLRLYLEPERALAEIPALRMLSEPAEAVRARAERLLETVAAALPEGCARLSVVDEIARAGGGALPMCDIPTFAVRVEFACGDALSCERHLVSGRAMPVVGRIKKEALLLDARTVLDGDEMAEIAAGLAEYFEEARA
ncbi:L-seryl-tRNA(Sec) selenium transferase [Arabiibacter massiliensis]|uniref:L-seryl-tRNA(Sec) selenium transferase n=1 Tax=Arabiibacter massiliensis TaxID=1870985 RepID=UPI0009BB3D6A|nr:L-seryl-tRNA(Sec) selenium transferase [Arabiibacter massiliensis]